MLAIYKSLIRPAHLILNIVYSCGMWNPSATDGNWQIDLELKAVQRWFTRPIEGIGTQHTAIQHTGWHFQI